MFSLNKLLAVAAAAAVIGSAAPASATFLDATFSGTVSISDPYPNPDQVVTINGAFTSYNASANLPQILGGDLDQYSFQVTALNPVYNGVDNSAVYGPATGTIIGYGQTVQNITLDDLTVNFTTGLVTATLLSGGAIFPPGFPGPIDFSPANGALLTGLYVSSGEPGHSTGGTISGDIETPEPASLALLGVGLAGLGVLRRRKNA